MTNPRTIQISVCRDFSRTPGPRLIEEGEDSGQLFREKVLAPKLNEALASDSVLVVDLDGTAGYGTSFLEEAFGGLIRESRFRLDALSKAIQFISMEEEYLLNDIKVYMQEAADLEA